MEDAIKQGANLLLAYGPKVVIFLLILLIGKIVANWVQAKVPIWLRKSGMADEPLSRFLTNLTRYVVLIAAVLLAALGGFYAETPKKDSQIFIR